MNVPQIDVFIFLRDNFDDLWLPKILWVIAFEKQPIKSFMENQNKILKNWENLKWEIV